MKKTIHNRQTSQPLDLRHLHTLLDQLSTRLQDADPARPWSEVALILMDDKQMADANRAALGHEDTTDVITLTYAPDPLSPRHYQGEILVNVQRAWEEGTRRGDPDHELALYIAHGCLHLTGADDLDPAGRRAMHRTQTTWLKHIEPAGMRFFASPS